MFNNVALDVFIGLVLVFLLYSLLVTILGEILATWMGLRSRILRVSIEKMLNDGYNHGSGFFSFLQRYFLKEFPDFKESFAGRFYEYPAIKYLSNKAGEQTTFFSQTKPSYLTAEIFADTLIQLIKDKGIGNTDMEKAGYSLKYNAHHIQQATLKHLNDMFVNSSGEIVVFKDKLKHWYNETQDRATGWYKRKLQLILFWLGFVIAVIFNVDTLRIARILSKDKEARNQLVEMGVQLAKDSNRYKFFVMPNGDTVQSQQVLDTSFARIKKDIDEASLVLGMRWPTGTLTKNQVIRIDIDNEEDYRAFSSTGYSTTFTELKKILGSVENIAADLNKKRNENIQKEQQAQLDSIRLRIALLESSPIPGKDSLKADSSGVGQDTIITDSSTVIKDSTNKDSSGSFNEKINSLRNSIQKIQQSDSGIQALARITLRNLKIVEGKVDSLTGNNFSQIDSLKLVSTQNPPQLIIYGKRKYTWPEKTWFVISNVFNVVTFIGFLITALMLSLGAPFWFDLLKKLVSLRGAGVKPEEKKPDQASGTATTTGEGILNLVPRAQAPVVTEPASTGLALAVKKVENELVTVKGILSVEEGFIKQNNGKNPAVEIYVENNAAETAAIAKIGNAISGYPVNYFIITEPKAHVGPGGEIENNNGGNGSGTLGCFLRKKDSADLFLLSCWHVLKANSDWSGSLGDPDIKDNSGTKIARITDGMLTDKFDVGIAQCHSTAPLQNKDNSNLGITKPWRKVTIADAVHEFKVQFTGKVNQTKDAVIYNHRVKKFLRYPDNHHLLLDLFSITIYDVNKNPTSPSSQGDSGSVVVGIDGCPLGILIGGDDKFSYVAKFSNFLDEDTTYRNYSIIS